jgi:hypothetical protein
VLESNVEERFQIRANPGDGGGFPGREPVAGGFQDVALEAVRAFLGPGLAQFQP